MSPHGNAPVAPGRAVSAARRPRESNGIQSSPQPLDRAGRRKVRRFEEARPGKPERASRCAPTDRRDGSTNGQLAYRYQRMDGTIAPKTRAEMVSAASARRLIRLLPSTCMSGSRLSLPTAHSDVPPVGVATIPTHSGGSTANVHPTLRAGQLAIGIAPS